MSPQGIIRAEQACRQGASLVSSEEAAGGHWETVWVCPETSGWSWLYRDTAVKQPL